MSWQAPLTESLSTGNRLKELDELPESQIFLLSKSIGSTMTKNRKAANSSKVYTEEN